MNDDTKPQASARNRYLIYGSLGVAYLTALLGFLFLADLTQWLVQAPRAVHLTVFYLREELMVIGIIAFAVALIANFKFAVLRWKGVLANSVAFGSLFVGGFLLVTYIMFQPQQSGAEFMSIAKAKKQLRRGDEVMVVEHGGDARAFPHKWMRQPHVVGDTIGGEEIVMTYCSLSHLGVAFSPYLGEEKAELKVFTQLQNNLIMFDTNTGQPIQQIYGTTEDGNEKLKEYPTQVMSFEAFADIYPQGKVLYNPGSGFRDTLTRMMLRTVINWQHELDGPVFPTIDVDEPGISRLHPKEMVWGVSLGEETVAFTFDHFERNNWIINTDIGGTPIVLVYYPEFETVGGFDRSLNGTSVNVADLTSIDAHGNTTSGKLTRIPVASEIFWMIWYAFYPETELRT